jgi:hypothetical protein
MIKHAFQSAKADTADATKVGSGKWNADHAIDAAGLAFPDSVAADETAPASGLKAFVRTLLGRPVVKAKDAQGFEQVLQRAAAFCRVGDVIGTTASLQTLGMSVAAAGTLTAAPPSTASHLASVQRTHIVSAGGAGSLASISNSGNSLQNLWRGNAAGRGGFLYVTRFGLVTMVAGNRGFWGLWDTPNAPSNVDPTTDTSKARLGVGFNANTGNWQLITNAESVSTPTVVDLGASFALDTTSIWELGLGCMPNDSTVYYRFRNLTTGAVVAGAITSNMPGSTTFLAAVATMTNNGTASAVTWAFIKSHIESDI